MTSPFPGMDPYLEGYMWSDVHIRLATQFGDQLTPLLSPRYAARLGIYMVGDLVPAHELGIVFPDVEIIRPSGGLPILRVSDAQAVAAIAPAPVLVPASVPLQVRQIEVEVRDVARNQLVTAIEILSPTNKREPGLAAYRDKRNELIMSGVHVLEIDLIRRGTRPWPMDDLPQSPYMVMLTRARRAQAEVWPIGLRERLPVLPVPLRYPDPDAPLDVQTALATIYDKADYGLTLDYTKPPPEPSLSAADAAWAATLVANR